MYPYFLLGSFTLLACGYLLLSFIFNIYLIEEDDVKLLPLKQRVTKEDAIAMVVAGVTIFAWIMILLIVGVSAAPKENPNMIAYYNAEYKYPDSADWKVVPRRLLGDEPSTEIPDQDLCYPWDSAKMPLVKTNTGITCGGANCGFRVGILATNAVITASGAVGGVTLGPRQARNLSLMFPGDHNSDNGFLIFSGTESNVNDYLNSLKICPVALKFSSLVYTKIDQ